MAKILLLEDETPLRQLLKLQLEEREYQVDEAPDLKTACRKLNQDEYDVVILDLVVPDGNSIVLLDKFSKQTAARSIIITANPTIPGVVDSIKKGAYNYLEKPVDPNVLYAQIEKILELNRMKFEHHAMAAAMVSDFTFDTVIYQSPQMAEVIERAKILADTGNTVLIYGETGVGKEVLAHALHNHSDRKSEVFLPLNCAAIPEELFESELFGFEKGAFTGATSNYGGRFFQANRGTLFLDEIGELPLSIQAKLLRILDERLIYPLRSQEPIKVDVRLIAATNRDLTQEVKTNEFRSDLYYRLRESSLTIPPLRERQEDILPLFRHFMKIYSRLFKRNVIHISKEAEKCLVNYKWEGNVRELKNAVKSIIPFKTTETIQLEDLSPVIMGRSDHPQSKVLTLEESEKQHIIKVLKITRFNISRASEMLGIARSRLYRKLNHYNLDQVDITGEEDNK